MSDSITSVTTVGGTRQSLKRLDKKGLVSRRKRSATTKRIRRAVMATEQSITAESGSIIMSPNRSTATSLPNTASDCVVDLTSDSLIDLTEQSPLPLRLRHPQSLSPSERPSCRYATTNTTSTNSDVIFLHSTTTDNDVIILNSSPPPTHTSYQLPTNDITKAPGEKRKKKCSSPPLIPSMTTPTTTTATTGKESPKPLTCPVCLETAAQFRERGSKLVTTICGHVFCSGCIRNAITTMHKCPSCRKTLTLKQYHQLFL